MSEKLDEEISGGTLRIPDGFFIYDLQLDDTDPIVKIINEDTNEERILKFPRSLAYYMRTQSCGSKFMQRRIEERAIEKIQDQVKAILGLL